jgi:hypothetical protein
MKTNTQNKTGLRNRSEQLSTDKTQTQTTEQRPPLPQLDYTKRRECRALRTSDLLALLRTEAPRLFKSAQIVGKWVWVQFTDKQPREVTTVLSQLGFHWNNKRQVWQHPCGQFRRRPSSQDPRERYGARAAAQEVPA